MSSIDSSLRSLISVSTSRSTTKVPLFRPLQTFPLEALRLECNATIAIKGIDYSFR